MTAKSIFAVCAILEFVFLGRLVVCASGPTAASLYQHITQQQEQHQQQQLGQNRLLAGHREVEVKTETDIAQLLEAGNGHRAVAAHNLNDASSRSHAIFTLTLEQRRKPTAPADSKAPKFLKSKLHLVDLAGMHSVLDVQYLLDKQKPCSMLLHYLNLSAALPNGVVSLS